MESTPFTRCWESRKRPNKSYQDVTRIQNQVIWRQINHAEFAYTEVQKTPGRYDPCLQNLLSWAESTSEVYVRNSEPKLKLLVKKAESQWHCTRRDAALISGNTVSPIELYLSGTHCRTKLCNQKQLTNSSEESTMLGGTRRWSSTTKKSWVHWELHIENEWWVAMVAFDTAKFYPKMKDVR